ncbi:MAG TPA: winged helix-turn-helix domain-containing protein [Gemmatimonadaceae bacterium]
MSRLRALRRRPKPGRPPRRSAADWRHVARLLRRGATACGYPTEQWTLQRAAHLIRREFGEHYHARYLARPLRALGVRPQRPAVQAQERDDALVAAWVKHDWPLIKKRLGAKGGRLPSRHVWGTVHGADVIRALRHFRRVLGTPLLLVWDHSNTHTDRRVQGFLAAHPRDSAAVFLPPYAPELNPEEQANALIKGRMANALPASITELTAWARRGIRHLQRHPEFVSNFFRHAGLPVNQLW